MRSLISRSHHRIAGAVAAALALAVGELIAGVSPASVSLTEAVGGLAIDYVPPPVKDFAIAVFGIHDKLALIIGMVVVTVVLGALVGKRAARRWSVAVWVFGLFGLLGAFSLQREPDIGWPSSIIYAAVAAAVALVALRVLYRWLPAAAAESGDASLVEEDMDVDEHAADEIDPSEGTPEPEISRRKFLVGVGAVFGLAVAAAAGGRLLLERTKQALAGREDVVLPQATETTTTTSPPTTAASPSTTEAAAGAVEATTTTAEATTTTGPAVEGAGPLPAGHSLDVDGISPIITPNDQFYLIDTALSKPQVNLEEWTLKVTGLVENPYEINFDELLTRPLVERYVTLSCVSNQVGGSLVGHAKWLGVPLSLILDEAGLLPQAEQIVGRSVDGFTVGFPSSIPYDGRDALVAVGMNDEPLPIEHGFPVRLVVAGLYGYVSATKWLSELELTTWDGFDAYWVPRGWAKEAPVKTQSRIDTPIEGRIAARARAIAGVAWAPHRGVDRVEVRIDEGEWIEAELSSEISDNSWRQWKVDWDPEPGRYRLQVRATDGDGITQTELRVPPAPDGATGWHTIHVTVVA
ncbi:MAG: molybdopterin-dependent oxidoreductase [bacterium]|nr:molybdopterin-dependent oxidoreductase [bacterium]MDE0502320.1 molybdopterin-dependent oxidoreductase [bacterium]